MFSMHMTLSPQPPARHQAGWRRELTGPTVRRTEQVWPRLTLGPTVPGHVGIQFLGNGFDVLIASFQILRRWNPSNSFMHRAGTSRDSYYGIDLVRCPTAFALELEQVLLKSGQGQNTNLLLLSPSQGYSFRIDLAWLRAMGIFV